MSNLQQRIFTALVAVILLVMFVLFSTPKWFFIGISSVFILGLVEWMRCLGPTNKFLYSLVVVLYLLLVIGLQNYGFSIAVILLLGLAANVWLWVAVFCYQHHHGSAYVTVFPVSSLLALLFILPALVALSYLRGDGAQASWWLAYPFALTWIVDSAAFFAGRAWGKTKLMVEVSPNKTIAGLYAGIISGLIFGGIVSCFGVPGALSHMSFLLLTLICVLASILGDLSISALKRLGGIKDSSNLIPGHGGILDRVDSLVPVLVVFASGLYFI